MRAVVCNQCGEVCTDDEAASRWWRLTRNFEGTGSTGGIIESLASVVSTTLDINLDLDLDGDDSEPEPEPEPERTDFDGPDPDLHFCRTACLAEWAHLAASVEP